MKYILEVTHKNGKRLKQPLYVSKLGSMYVNPANYRMFDSEIEAIRGAASLMKMHKEINKINYDMKVIAVEYPLVQEVKPSF